MKTKTGYKEPKIILKSCDGNLFFVSKFQTDKMPLIKNIAEDLQLYESQKVPALYRFQCDFCTVKGFEPISGETERIEHARLCHDEITITLTNINGYVLAHILFEFLNVHDKCIDFKLSTTKGPRFWSVRHYSESEIKSIMLGCHYLGLVGGYHKSIKYYMFLLIRRQSNENIKKVFRVKNFKCAECDCNFKDWNLFELHNGEVHARGPHGCLHCNDTFQPWAKLKLHWYDYVKDHPSPRPIFPNERYGSILKFIDQVDIRNLISGVGMLDYQCSEDESSDETSSQHGSEELESSHYIPYITSDDSDDQTSEDEIDETKPEEKPSQDDQLMPLVLDSNVENIWKSLNKKMIDQNLNNNNLELEIKFKEYIPACPFSDNDWNSHCTVIDGVEKCDFCSFTCETPNSCGCMVLHTSSNHNREKELKSATKALDESIKMEWKNNGKMPMDFSKEEMERFINSKYFIFIIKEMEILRQHGATKDMINMFEMLTSELKNKIEQLACEYCQLVQQTIVTISNAEKDSIKKQAICQYFFSIFQNFTFFVIGEYKCLAYQWKIKFCKLYDNFKQFKIEDPFNYFTGRIFKDIYTIDTQKWNDYLEYEKNLPYDERTTKIKCMYETNKRTIHENLYRNNTIEMIYYLNFVNLPDA